MKLPRESRTDGRTDARTDGQRHGQRHGRTTGGGGMTKVWQKSIDRYWTYRGNIKFSGAFGHAVTLTCDILTPKWNQFISVPRCTSNKRFGENPSTDTRDIAET